MCHAGALKKPCKLAANWPPGEPHVQRYSADSSRVNTVRTTFGMGHMGRAGFRGGPSGDLYVVLHVRPHEIFQRDGDDLLCEVPINFVQAPSGRNRGPAPRWQDQLSVSRLAHSRRHVPASKAKGVKNIQGLRSWRPARAHQCRSYRRICRPPQKAQVQELPSSADRQGKPHQPKLFFRKAKIFFNEP